MLGDEHFSDNFNLMLINIQNVDSNQTVWLNIDLTDFFFVLWFQANPPDASLAADGTRFDTVEPPICRTINLLNSLPPVN